MTIIIFLIVLAVLIFVHELGHFLLSRWNGIRVDAFKIGFGPRILSWRRKETEFGLNLIPFGGFVRIHGEDPDEESLNGPDADRSFAKKSRWRQVTVLAAGVLFNFIFAWLLYISIFATGITATKEGFEKYSDHFGNERIMITYVEPGSPADAAGIKIGDVIRNVGKSNAAQDGGLTIESIQTTINDSKGSPIRIEYSRDDYRESTDVTPKTGLVEDRYAIGIAMNDVVDLKLPFLTSIYEGVRYTGVMIRETTIGLYNFISNIFRGQADFSDVSGPIGIAGIVGSASELGFTYLLMITALISINLGVINLIPFPALDGGRILFVLLEGIFRRRIPMRFANTVNSLGFILLMILMVVVTYKDIAKLLK